jgi:hypothetical protein
MGNASHVQNSPDANHPRQDFYTPSCLTAGFHQGARQACVGRDFAFGCHKNAPSSAVLHGDGQGGCRQRGMVNVIVD